MTFRRIAAAAAAFAASLAVSASAGAAGGAQVTNFDYCEEGETGTYCYQGSLVANVGPVTPSGHQNITLSGTTDTTFAGGNGCTSESTSRNQFHLLTLSSDPVQSHELHLSEVTTYCPELGVAETCTFFVDITVVDGEVRLLADRVECEPAPPQ